MQLSTPFPGITLQRLKNTIIQNPDLVRHPFVLIHVGTNNLYINSPSEMFCLFSDLVDQILQISSQTIVIISSIVPRLIDYDVTKDLIKTINTNLETTPIPNTIYIQTFGPFLRSGTPRKELYACDGLHLLPRGVLLLRHVWQTTLSDIQKRRVP